MHDIFSIVSKQETDKKKKKKTKAKPTVILIQITH